MIAKTFCTTNKNIQTNMATQKNNISMHQYVLTRRNHTGWAKDGIVTWCLAFAARTPEAIILLYNYLNYDTTIIFGF